MLSSLIEVAQGYTLTRARTEIFLTMLEEGVVSVTTLGDTRRRGGVPAPAPQPTIIRVPAGDCEMVIEDVPARRVLIRPEKEEPARPTKRKKRRKKRPKKKGDKMAKV